jgi:hypothetical protein
MRGFCASPSGGTGRRARLKIWCSQGRARSSRAWGTIATYSLNTGLTLLRQGGARCGGAAAAVGLGKRLGSTGHLGSMASGHMGEGDIFEGLGKLQMLQALDNMRCDWLEVLDVNLPESSPRLGSDVPKLPDVKKRELWSAPITSAPGPSQAFRPAL